MPGPAHGRSRGPQGDQAAGPFPAVSCPRRARKGTPPGSPGGEDVLPAAGTGCAGAAGTNAGAADQQKISARPDQRPGCGTDRAAQADQAGIGTKPQPCSRRYVTGASQRPRRVIPAVSRCDGSLMVTALFA